MEIHTKNRKLRTPVTLFWVIVTISSNPMWSWQVNLEREEEEFRGKWKWHGLCFFLFNLKKEMGVLGFEVLGREQQFTAIVEHTKSYQV